MPSPTWTSMLLSLAVLFLATLAQADEQIQQLPTAPTRLLHHRRLFGIRRLKAAQPITPPSSEQQKLNPNVRRQQQRNFEIIELPDFVPRAQVPPAFEGRRIEAHVEPTTHLPLIRELSSETEDVEDLKRKKIEARWKRLGINPKTIYYPTRKPKIHKEEEEEEDEATDEEPVTHIPDVVKAIRDRQRNRIQQLNIEERERVVRPARNYGINKDNINVPSTLNTRKSVPTMHEDKDIRPRPRIQGPILSSPGDLGSPVQTPAIPRVFAPLSSPQNGDYHSRTAPVRRNYQFMERLSQRPRLRIRRPGDPRPEESVALTEDPTLTPFQNNARNRVGFGLSGLTSGPLASLPRQPPPVTTTTAAPTKPTTTTKATTTTTTTTTTTAAPENEGESGAGFGAGPSELPPEFANIGFGIGDSDGNGINFPSQEMSKPQRLKQRKQPNPELEVIPQNSGLRPVAPPKEFGGGGFGPGGGGFGGGGFGGGGGSFGGGGFGGGAPGGGFGGGGSAGGAPDEEGPSEADLFTGDSALQPSKGPTGDGYGPPIFPGGAAPPPVPAVGLGGAAAGKSPYAPMIDATENPPTTVKPSAMLSILNKADQGFNQAISHFEKGTPVETAAIDILEVALGSEKLDSQAKLLGHVDRTIGLDNLQRIQRWANTAGAMDFFKEQFVRLAKNFEPAEDLLPTVPPQFEYLFKRGR